MNVGKLSLEDDKLVENVHAAVAALEEVLGKTHDQIIHRMHLAPTMGASVKVAYSK